MNRVLVATPNKAAGETIKASINEDVQLAGSGRECRQMFGRQRYEYLFIDLDFLESKNIKDGLHTFWKVNPTVEIVVLSAQDRIREAVMAVKAGASNYLTYPLDTAETRFITETIYESMIVHSELDYLRDKFWQTESMDFVRTRSKEMQQVLNLVKSVAPTRSTVLLNGDTGVGKSVLAKLIHSHSNRKEAPFISVHCGAIPDTLIESELFGHEKGAFTGALRRKLGRFEIAQEGTIFLDEIGTITPAAQVKLLQVLQDGSFCRVGGEETIESGARIIAASNIDLKTLAEQGDFRKDLYYRLNVFPIDIPSLNARMADLPLLVDGFIKKLNRFYAKDIRGLHPDVLEAFKEYSWPGNIRELENLIERAFILENSPLLSPDSFPQELFHGRVLDSEAAGNMTLAEARNVAINEMEYRYLHEQLAQQQGSVKNTAAAAGITTRQLHKLMQKHGLKKENYKH